MRLLLSLVLMCNAFQVQAADLRVRVESAQQNGKIVIQVYDNANAFGNFRNPARQERFSIQSDGIYEIRDIPAGNVAVLVYVDENDNGTLDRNFMGIPKEPLGLSNNYRPKGPPGFQRASIAVDEDTVQTLDLELYRTLGNAGQWGLGVGVIGRTSPYLNSDSNVLKVIPAISYFGKRLQWFGPELRYGLTGSGDLRLALTATYRIGVYDQDDSPVLVGLGDRKSTLLAGLSLVYEGPLGTELGVRYQHDMLDRIGGGAASVSISRAFQAGIVRLVPELGVNWLGDELGNHDFGVPDSAAIPGRPAYSVGNSINKEVGIRAFIELSENWGAAFSLSTEFLDDHITNSPIVDDDRVTKGFAAITYAF